MGIIPVSIRRTGTEGHMLDQAAKGETTSGEYVEFVSAGTQATGAYHCAECGYGITVHTVLPNCPMCAGTTWELHDWSPFTRPSRLQ
jgi:rubrerythrin